MTDELLNDWYEQLLSELEVTKAAGANPLQQVTTSMRLIKAAIFRIREALQGFTFNEELTEIRLNKYWMVRFYALFIYQTECFRVMDSLPKGGVKVKCKHYQQHQKALQRHLQDYSIWFGYYKNELEVFDGALFRGRGADVLFLPESPDFFGHELPHCTYIFARFMAYERLIGDLELKINPTPEAKVYSHGLIWTGNKVNIAELAYGLYYAGQFNHGNAEVTDIYRWLEESLGISMGSVHRKFIDLRRRNTASPTKLLDKMREAIHQRIDEDLRYKPNRGIKLTKTVSDD
jgi:hypothetical protein